MLKKRDIDKENNEEGSPAWMTTYGDMMTLLLVFFVFLYSFSVMDIEKFEGFISALKNQLGVLDAGRTITDYDSIDVGAMNENIAPSLENITMVMSEMQSYIRENNLQDRINLKITERGLVVSFTGEILYDVGEAEIKPRGKEILDEIVRNIKDIPNAVAVEGHTDDWPINTEQFPSNWELSTTRAVNVIKYFIEEHSLSPRRLSAAGYSEYRPLVPNDSAENRAKNRRVEIVVLNTGISDNYRRSD